MSYTNSPVKSIYFDEFEADLPEQKDKVVVITGCTSGTGFVAACTSLKKGARIIMLNRASERTTSAVNKLKELFPEAADMISTVECDLMNFESVRDAAVEVQKLAPEGIDVLANNAGIMAFENRATKDGYDIQMQTNHLSHFLLTSLLFPFLKKKSGSRVVNHSSNARFIPNSRLDAKYFEKDMSVLGDDLPGINQGRWVRYHHSKLANSVFTNELARRIKQENIDMLCVVAHPGTAVTMLAQGKGEGNLEAEVQKNMDNGQSPEDGSMGLLRCMFSPDVEQGCLYGPPEYSGKAQKIPLEPELHSKDDGAMLWTKSEEACGVFNLDGPEP